jgi:hypothetical protein
MKVSGSIQLFIVFLTLIGSTACTPLPQFPFAAEADLAPPRILELGFRGSTRLSVGFDEPCEVVKDSLLRGDTLLGIDVDVTDNARPAAAPDGVAVPPVPVHELLFTFSIPPDPGHEHTVEAQVVDPAGNHLRFVARFYGLNELVPAMIINEFTTQGSGSHPDLVEIRVLTDGNLAGCCLYEGVPGNWDEKLVFPDLSVRTGDFIVVHFKPQGLPDEVNETIRTDESGGYDTSPEAWDFWVPDGTGLSGNNGVITLCENPIGGVIDGVLYSNRTSDSDDQYRGFGSTTVVERADYLVAQGAWTASGLVRPEDAVDPEDSTATRSIARGTDGADTNHRDDWHITPTRGLTPGSENADAVYVP